MPSFLRALRAESSLGRLLALLLLALLFAGCGPEGPGPSVAEVSPSVARSTPVSPQYLANGPPTTGNVEGSGRLAAVDGSPPERDLIANGGDRFRLPLKGQFEVRSAYRDPRASGLVHLGLDLAQPGTPPVFAVCDGAVTRAGVDDARGLSVSVDCGSGWEVSLAYLGRTSLTARQLVSEGDNIGQLDGVLGFVHLELRWGGQPVDPELYLDLAGLPRSTPTPGPTGAPSANAARTPSPSSSAPAEFLTPTLGAPSATRTFVTATPSHTPAAPTATRTPTPSPLPATPTPTATPTATSTPTAVPPTPVRTPTPRPRID